MVSHDLIWWPGNNLRKGFDYLNYVSRNAIKFTNFIMNFIPDVVIIISAGKLESCEQFLTKQLGSACSSHFIVCKVIEEFQIASTTEYRHSNSSFVDIPTNDISFVL